MVTLFGILNVGASGLFAAQAALNTTGHNIANASTEGYSRQRVVQAVSPPIETAVGIFGSGTKVISVERIRDAFLDGQLRNASSDAGFYEELDNIFLRIEAILNDPLTPISEAVEDASSGGLNSIISHFYAAWHELANSPEAPEARSAVLEAGRTLAETLNLVSKNFNQLRTDLNDRVNSFVNEVNGLARNIADLNGRIVVAEADTAHHANDLRDERDRLIDRLAEIVPARILDIGGNQIAVTVLGVRMVDGTETNLLEIRSGGGVPVPVDHIFFHRQGIQALDQFLEEGRLGGLVDARDRIMPQLADQIDQLSRSIIQEVNRIHSGAAGTAGYRSLTSTFTFPSGSNPPNSTKTLDVIFNNPVLAPDTSSSAYPFEVTDGELTVRVATKDNETRGTFSVNIRLSDNLNDVVERINRADGVVSIARSASLFDPVFYADARSVVSFDPADVIGGAAVPLSALFPDVPVGFDPGPFQLEIHIKDSAGALIDANPGTSAIDPFIVAINAADTLSDVAAAISVGTGGRAAADFVTDPGDPSKVKFRIRAARSGETVSVQGDTSGIIRAMQLPVTDPSVDLVGGVSDQAAGTFAVGAENTSFFTPGANPNFSAVFPGPPPSVIGEGSFDVIVVDARGNTRATQTIAITDGGIDTINDVAAQLNGMADLNASVTANGKLNIQAINDSHFFFRNDTTGLIKALGLDNINGHGEVNGLPFQSGTFEVVVADERGKVTSIFNVSVDADPVTGVMSLSDIVRAINGAASAVAAPILASLAASPKDSSKYVLQVEATRGHQFTFRSDDTLLLAALGFAGGPVLDQTGGNPIIGASDVTKIGDTIGPTVSASWDPVGNIVISSPGTDEISFLDDTSHFLASAGLNTFFGGWDAGNIRVKEEISNNPRLLATSKTGAPGDNQAALAISDLSDTAVLEGGSHGDYYRSIISRLGTEAARTSQFAAVNAKLLQEFKNIREEASGVSLDEESINLIRFQQAFQASARLIATLDQLLTMVITMGS